MTSDTSSEPILHSDLTVTVPDDEEEIFKAIRFFDVCMLRNQLKLGVDVNFIHAGTCMMLKHTQCNLFFFSSPG